ncbi:MAG TPA: Ig-like domain-containing protein, partial [Mycobacterium sp.]|uniref:Ig-like domain-containing protein n=1 Tax=Mycobacterium sp. TaxID=1785 RepID=UPI002D7582C9
TAAGSVQFTNWTMPLGSPVTVAGGSASMTTTLTPGTHPLTAVFTPAGSTAFDPSKSDTLSYTVSAPTTTPLPPTPPAFRFSPTSLSQLIPWLLGQLHLPTF